VALLRPEVSIESRAAYLRVLGEHIRRGPAPPASLRLRWCRDPEGRDIFAAPYEIARQRCADCKKLSVLAARRALDAGHDVDLVMTSDMEPEQHVWLRIDGRHVDPSIAAGMPPIDPRRRERPVIVNVSHLYRPHLHAAGPGDPSAGFRADIQRGDYQRIVMAAELIRRRFPWTSDMIDYVVFGLCAAWREKLAPQAGTRPSWLMFGGGTVDPSIESLRRTFLDRFNGDDAAWKRSIERGRRVLGLFYRALASNGGAPAKAVDAMIFDAGGNFIPPWKPGATPTPNEADHLAIQIAAEADGYVQRRFGQNLVQPPRPPVTAPSRPSAPPSRAYAPVPSRPAPPAPPARPYAPPPTAYGAPVEAPSRGYVPRPVVVREMPPGYGVRPLVGAYGAPAYPEPVYGYGVPVYGVPGYGAPAYPVAAPPPPPLDLGPVDQPPSDDGIPDDPGEAAFLGAVLGELVSSGALGDGGDLGLGGAGGMDDVDARGVRV
jgi:hypothetical protein